MLSTSMSLPVPVDNTTCPTSTSLPPIIVNHPKSRPLQVYRRRQQGDSTTSAQVDTTFDSSGQPPSDLHLPIALRCGKRHCTSHLISHFVSYDHLSSSFRQFALSISTETVPKNYSKTL